MTTPQLRVFLQRWFCGCGDPEDAATRLRDILALHPLHSNRAAFEALIPDVGLQHLTLYSIDHFGLTEHGGSIGGAWLTQQGEDVLAALKAADMDTLFDTACLHGNLVDGDPCPECAAYFSR